MTEFDDPQTMKGFRAPATVPRCANHPNVTATHMLRREEGWEPAKDQAEHGPQRLCGPCADGIRKHINEMVPPTEQAASRALLKPI
jgi:hypothetical protein